MYIYLIFSLFCFSLEAKPYNLGLWSKEYDQKLLSKAGKQISALANHPSFQFPNNNYEKVFSKSDKVWIFGYGSLMNKSSAVRSIKPGAVNSMKPVIAFGVKRIFNYKAGLSFRWGNDPHPLEQAMLNLIPMTTYHSIANGVIMEVDLEDLEKLVKRETGYDLVPLLVANWNDILEANPNPEIQIVYTFIAPNELRGKKDYTEKHFYPVRGYLKAAEAGALEYGHSFQELFDYTTFLANGTTRIPCWDRNSFEGLLMPTEPKP